ncbi:FMN-dependent dehydrogenase-domain-containing protein [Aspergillus heterothallicus]
MYRISDIASHKTESDCWIAIHGIVYDVTKFLPSHPGGQAIILKHAGTDATAAFETVHPVDILEEYLRPEQRLGELDPSSRAQPVLHNVSINTQASQPPPTPLHTILSLAEMESLALRRLSPKALSYYASATDDEITKTANGTIYRLILLRPRVFVNCSSCDISTTILGNPVGLPVFIAPAALAKLAHPCGEAGIASACSALGALQIISKNASLSVRDIVAAGPRAVFAWQLYVLKDLDATERTLAQIRQIPQIRFIVLTLDAPFPGKREADERFKAAEVAAGTSAPQIWGTEAGLTWAKTLAWLGKHTDLPIVLKGIQTWEDAALAARYSPAVRGIILSNHGGRALDTATTPVQVLLEIRKFAPWVFHAIEVFVDGGVRRGTDVVKALALGARGVGIGRAALYGLSVGGEGGVRRTLEILAEEVATAMRLLGVSRVDDLGPQHVNTAALNQLLLERPLNTESASVRMGAKL